MSEDQVQTYRVTNTARSPRIVYSANRRAITIPPGKSQDVPLDPTTAGRLVSHDSGLEVSNETTRHQPRPQTTVPVDAPPKSEPNAWLHNPKSNRPLQAADLVADLVEKRRNYPEVVADAKTLLGDRWPGGNVKKSDLIDLLKSEGA